ncbi:M48 family metallopeptidase [Paenibacillus sp. CF384]|uniref:M48 family metallopeptidase n=1 Tax=Paenibacillus sp. CF384 TaxID=1884382 RepID=UPI00089A8038|nr:M48 family metallopeptidase [Paenibacillus sp. CF384]SDX98923.1 Zn-dependent protease with chaperone function [Paenibacillus sp. CF384]
MSANIALVQENRTAVQIEQCPECQSHFEANPNFMSWCECGWNLKPHRQEHSPSVFASFYERLGQRVGKQLLGDMEVLEHLLPKPTKTRLFTLVMATVIHAISLAMVLLCLFALSIYREYPVLAILAAPMLILIWTQRPRIPKLSKDEKRDVVPREQFPTLYAFANQIADYLHMPHFEGILINEEFNASYRQVGLRQKRYLTLGLPLFSILSPAEKAALVGHEVGHGINGDSIRNLYTLTAIITLENWFGVLASAGDDEDEVEQESLIGIAAKIVGMLLMIVAFIPDLLITLFIHSFYYESQKAEYMADYLGAKVGGTEGALGLSRKMFCNITFVLSRQRFVLRGAKGNYFDELKAAVASIPSREFERIRRVEMMEGSTLDRTHPPTAYRIQTLQHHAQLAPGAIQLTDVQLKQLDRELSAVEAKMQERLVNQFREKEY